MTLPVAKIFPRNLGIAVAAVAVSAPLIWATALAHQRLGAAEDRLREQTMWIDQQTRRIQSLEASLQTMNITLARIDENVKELRRQQARGGAGRLPPAAAGDGDAD